MTLVASVASPVLTVATTASATVPGSPGVAQPGTVVFNEDFENAITNAANGAQSYSGAGSTAYVGTTPAGQSYSGATDWINGHYCNGVILSDNNSTPPPWLIAGGVNGNNLCSEAPGDQSYEHLRTLALAMGNQFGGGANNHVDSSYTECQNTATGDTTCSPIGSGPTNGLMFRTNGLIPVTPNHYYTFSVDTAYINCGTAAGDPQYQFALIDAASTVTPVGGVLDGCTAANTSNVQTYSQVVPYQGTSTQFPSTYTVRLASMVASSAFQYPASSLGVELYNQSGVTFGNDGAFDNVRVIDVTPQLDKSFSPATISVGGTSTLTYTITNSSELDAKNGWSYVDSLPAGVTATGVNSTTCSAGVISAPAGGGSVSVTGNLNAGQTSCTVSVQVTSSVTGAHVNTGCAGASPPASCATLPNGNFTGPTGGSTLSGLNPPGTTTLTVTPTSGGVISTFTGPSCANGTSSLLARWQGSGVGTSPVAAPGPRINLNTTASGYPAGSIHMDWVSATGAGPTYDLFTPTGTGLASQYAVPSMELRTPSGGPLSTQVVDITFPAPTAVYFPILDVDTSEYGSIQGFNGATAVAGDVSARNGSGGLTVTQAGTVSNFAATAGAINYPDSDDRGLLDVNFSTPVTSIRLTDNLPYGTNEIGDLWGCQAQDVVKMASAPTIVSTSATGVTYHTNLTFVTGNTQTPGAMRLYGPQVTDNLGSDLGGSPAYSAASVTNISATGPAPACTVNSSYSGIGNNTMLAGPASAFLAAGESCVITVGVDVTYPYSATQFIKNNTAVASGQGTNPTITDTSTNGGSLPGSPKGDSPSPTPLVFPPVSSSIGLTKVADRASYQAGDTITYTFVATNTGQAPLANVSISDPLPGLSALTCSPTAGSSLAPGATMTCTATKVASASDVSAGQIANTATAVGTTPTGSTVSATASAVVHAVSIDLVKSAAITTDANNDGKAGVGDQITFSYLVTNTGSQTLSNVSVADVLVAPAGPAVTVTCPTATLAPGQSETCGSSAYVVTQADVDAGSVADTATASGIPPTGGPVVSPPSSTSTPTPSSDSIAVVKSASITTDANGDGKAGVGDQVTFSYLVTNTGSQTLSNVSVGDVLVAPAGPAVTVTCPTATLAPGQSETCTSSPYVVTQSDVNAGSVADTATATGTPPTGGPVVSPPSSTSTPTPTTDAITVVKSASITTDANNDGKAGVGDQITFSYVVTNTGSQTLSDVSVADVLVAPAGPAVTVTCPIATLAPGESETCTSSAYVVTQADVDAGSVADTATASGTPPTGGPVVSPPSSTSTPTPTNPALTLVKTAELSDSNGDGVAEAGETITYRFLVTNTGDVTMTGIKVDDPLLTGVGIAVTCPSDMLEPGASETCASGPYVITPADVAAGQVVNVATAVGNPPGHHPPTVSPPSRVVTPIPPVGVEPGVIPASPKTPPATGVLARTGFNALWMGEVALGLILTGLLLLGLDRRRRRTANP